MLKPFIATLRVVLYCTDEVRAMLAIDTLVDEASKFIEPDDGDTIAIAQLTPYAAEVSAEETLVLLRRARNALIRVKIRSAWDVAGQLDQQIHLLRRQYEPGYEPQYDHGRFMELTDAILKRNEDPIE